MTRRYRLPRRLAPREAVRLFAIFWIVTVVFFSIAAYKRRAYLLPLWPPSAVMLAWMVPVASRRFGGRALKSAYAAVCVVMIVLNLVIIPRREARECAGDSFRPAANEIAKVVASSEPLYLYGFDEEVAPLLFYLDRDAPEWSGKLGDAPPGYIIVPAGVWAKKRAEALDLEPVLESNHGNRHLILLHRGKVYARNRAKSSDGGLAQGGACEDAGRVEGRQRRILLADEQRNFGA